MNSMNDERFFDLTMKVVVRQASAAERAELDTLLAAEPGRRAEFERLRHAAGLAREVLPLVQATEATAGELPGYARGRLQTKVRQTYGTAQTKNPPAKAKWNWRWALGLATAVAAIVLVAVPLLSPRPKLEMQVAMLDLAGTSRGGDTNDVALLRETLQAASVESFSKASELAAWQERWPSDSKGMVVKVVYDRSAGEVRVIGRKAGAGFEKVFQAETNPAAALKQAGDFVREEMKRR